MERQFTSGSRQAPDPFDQFLEEHSFYRKHTARDASCLFRVISEQMYDTQLHHLAMREKCVTYMRKHRKHFDYLVERDFDDYLDDMSKPKTYGTLLELQAASYMFERNVFLFQPFNLGNYFNEYRSNFVEVFRVFYTPERHFDSVFTSEYIQEAAICQSICYEILYKDLFKLPDVSFAVEQMLHGPTLENVDYHTETNEEGYTTRFNLNDGRSFELDLPHNTNCILENYKLCHFHYNNFPRYSDDLQRELKSGNYEEYDKNSLIIQRTTESFLPNKYVSCVRQLLQEGITPFPYKVAKALDPNMYRNIEFDSWNEMRKELKLQNWYNGDANFKLIRYSTRRVRKIFQVGAKCHVKLHKSEQDLYTCHIQEIAVDKGQCIVFVEQLGEKRLVPYENLTPLPPEEFKPWTMPYRLQRHMQKYSSVRFTRQYNYRFKLNTTTEHLQHHEFACEAAIDTENCSNNCISDDPKKLVRQQPNQHCAAAASYFKLKQYTHLEDFRTHVEYCTMPLTVAHSNREIDVSNPSNQARMIDSNDNSRAPSRSSTSAGVHRNNMDAAQYKGPSNAGSTNIEEQLGAPPAYRVPYMEPCDVDHYNPNGPIYVPEMTGFYPMYPYSTSAAIPEDYYGYCGFDSVLPPAAAVMPSVNNINGFYYLCNNSLAPHANYINASNPFFHPAPPHQPVGLAPPCPMLSSVNTTNPYCTPPINSAQSNQSLAPPSSLHSVNNTTSRLPHRTGSNISTSTSLHGRINYEAKKSVKADGVDLPNDVATLRYFYNIGLDYYHKQKSNVIEADITDDHETLSNDLQNIRVEENVNQNLCSKSDSNTTNCNSAPNDGLHANDSNLTANQTNKLSSNAQVNLLSCAGGNKNNNNQRRYGSRYFNGKDRQTVQRNNTNQNPQSSGQQQQQHLQNNVQNNQHQRNFNNTKCSNNFYNGQSIARNTPLQTNQQINLQPQQHVNYQQLSVDHARQISGNSETSIRTNSSESRNCNTPTTTNNSNTGIMYASNSDKINDGIASGVGNNAKLIASVPSPTGGLFVPISAVPPPPPPPYGIYAAHPSANGGHPTPGMGVHSNYVTVPPTQIITHCGLTPSKQMSCGPGSDNMENAPTSEIASNNGVIMTMSPPVLPLHSPNYHPPMPFYYSAGSANSLGGSTGGPLSASTNGVHLVPSPLSHPIPPPPTLSNQTAFAAPHPPMGTQAYYCLPPPPPQLLTTQQQVAHQMVQQSTPMAPNKVPLSNNLSHDANNNELVQQNDE